MRDSYARSSQQERSSWYLVAVAPAASATVSCSDAGLPTVAITADDNNDTATVRIGTGGAILVNGTACGTVTTANTTAITVTGAANAQTLVIDQSGTEAFGSAIDWTVDLAGGTAAFRITGSSGADNIRVGASGVNLDAGKTSNDVTLANVENFAVNAGGGDDIVSSAGGQGTGGASASVGAAFAAGHRRTRQTVARRVGGFPSPVGAGGLCRPPDAAPGLASCPWP